MNKQTTGKPRTIGDGTAGPGRPKGSQNKTTALLKEAIIMAAEQTGIDGEGDGGLVGYCRFLAKEEPKAFASLMGRVLPMQVTGDASEPVHVAITRIERVIVDPRGQEKNYAGR